MFRCFPLLVFQFACLVEGCPDVLRSRRGRQLHLVDKHSYPPNYSYDRPITRNNGKGGRARHKERPKRIDPNEVDMELNTQHTHADNTDTTNSTAIAPTSPTPAMIAATAVAATPPRPAVVSRSTVLSFMPRAVHANKVAAKSGLPISTFLPARSPAFTVMRDSSATKPLPPPISSNSHDADSMVDAADRANQCDDDDDDTTMSTMHGDDMDVDHQVTMLSRLNVEGAKPATVPRKLTFGARALHRRHG